MAMPITRMRVVCTLGETMLTFEPTSALTRVDLPALGAPTMATKPARVLQVCVMHSFNRSSSVIAASRSASRLLPPRPRAGSCPLIDRHRRRRPAHAAALRDRPRDRPAAAGAAPAPIPAAPSWDRAAPRAWLLSRSPHSRSTQAAAAAKPASRKTAPSSASSASARMVGRTAPPCARSDSPSRISAPRPIVVAISTSVSARTSAAWRRASSPSRSCGKRRSSRSAMASDSTRSPRNSSRSLPCGKGRLEIGPAVERAAMGQRLGSKLGARESMARSCRPAPRDRRRSTFSGLP